MRDILKDLGTGASGEDPMRKAQRQMQRPLPKRFYETASASRAEDGFAVLLDGKQVHTPARRALVLPTSAAAELVAAEFAAQETDIDPATMPVTRLVNTALDGVATDMQAVSEDILRFSANDLLCYRAEGPERLVALQAQAWDPVLDWARAALGAHFVLAEGVMHVDQPREAVGAIGIHLSRLDDPLRLAAVHSMTTLTGSALLALAVALGEMGAVEAWAAAHVDEDWNESQWGVDAEAARRRAMRWADMEAAGALLAALGAPSSQG